MIDEIRVKFNYVRVLNNTRTARPRERGYKVWQEGNHPELLYSDKFITQKENYIHMNPVEAGIVSQPHYYRLSSASDESPIKVLPIR